jgi:hypothetical protein
VEQRRREDRIMEQNFPDSDEEEDPGWKADEPATQQYELQDDVWDARTDEEHDD